LSAQSQWSVLSWRSSRGFLSAGAMGAVAAALMLTRTLQKASEASA
jgi:hypothetical protein